MIISKCLSILMMACLALALAAKGNAAQIKVRPITREQYDNILKLNDGKPVIPEGRLINSAISGLAGLAAGFQLNRLLPNWFGNTQKVKLDGYPLCTINTEDIAGRQLEEPSYVNVDELANSLVHPVKDSHGTLMNCILVLDDGKPATMTTEKPPHETTTKPDSTTETPTTAEPEAPSKKPPHHPHHPHYPDYPDYPHYPYYPHYSHYYPLLPPPFYPPYPYPPPHYHTTPEPETEPEQDEPVNLHSLIIDKIEAITGVTSTTTTTTTTKKPTHKTRRRPHNRHPPQPYPGFPQNYPVFNPTQTTPRRLTSPHDLDEYDDSIDYIEVSKKSKPQF